MKSILLLSGLLLASGGAFAQGYNVTPKPAPVAAEVVPDGKMVVPVSPAILPGEEQLSARERVERDMLMPPRRERAALQAASEEATAEAKEETPEATVTEEAPETPAAHPATQHRRRIIHRRR